MARSRPPADPRDADTWFDHHTRQDGRHDPAGYGHGHGDPHWPQDQGGYPADPRAGAADPAHDYGYAAQDPYGSAHSDPVQGGYGGAPQAPDLGQAYPTLGTPGVDDTGLRGTRFDDWTAPTGEAGGRAAGYNDGYGQTADVAGGYGFDRVSPGHDDARYAEPQWGEPQVQGGTAYGADVLGGQGAPAMQADYGAGYGDGLVGAPGHFASQSDGALAPRDDYDAYDDEDEFEDEASEGSWGRTFLIAGGALLGAVIVGGGLAFGYATFLAPSSKSNSPLIRSSEAPAKVAPAERGGTQFANQDSQLLNRLDQGRGAPSSDGRSRTVSTLVVKPDGTMVAAPARERPPERSSTDSAGASSSDRIVIPGLTIVGVNTDTRTDGGAARASGTGSAAAVPSLPVDRGDSAGGAVVNTARVLTRPVVPTIANAGSTGGSAVRAGGGIPLPPRNQWIDRTRAVIASPETPRAIEPVRAEASATPRSVPRAVDTASSGGVNGFVAVLASKGSRTEALATYADLSQMYGGALQGRVPDIQAADLSDRGLGTMYRVVVGPPGSRDAANDVCSRLRSAGYTGCWVKAY